jgi:hypothetical protein
LEWLQEGTGARKKAFRADPKRAQAAQDINKTAWDRTGLGKMASKADQEAAKAKWM